LLLLGIIQRSPKLLIDLIQLGIRPLALLLGNCPAGLYQEELPLAGERTGGTSSSFSCIHVSSDWDAPFFASFVIIMAPSLLPKEAAEDAFLLRCS
jgi:hypothetical protein